MVVDFYKTPVAAHENERYIEYGVSVLGCISSLPKLLSRNGDIIL